MANLSILTFSILILASSVVANGLLGGRTKVPDVKTNKEIQAMGRYSVEEYNRLRRSTAPAGNDDGDLVFSQVVEAEKQVVAGMKYYLKVETVDKRNGDLKVFQAVVEIKPWLRSKQLLKFAPAPAMAISLPVW